MPGDRDQWLAQVKEEILEPDLPICDPHHHLWDHPGRRYLIDELKARLMHQRRDGEGAILSAHGPTR